ncbi:hypothetical protein [Bacillus thuringiensis]|uniref:Uncharacterized protein n=1 Tax=Bacillus thuringiensis TaxID=1428 RepID=A0A9X6Z521_BACTU|nr:hypothetical protein [Bacillus thuringiensis]MCU5279878.1 hypothetical protein [Bacillus cereus]MEC3270683.1 hypothetical protein [Bacillus thuringiensis]PFB08093.1 hypothetical protein CN398_10265 [Bacillus thuringiensis]
MTRVVNCKRCKYHGIELGKGFSDIKSVCKKEQKDFSNIPDDKYEEEIEKQIDCKEFESKYIEYPLEISGIDFPKDKGIRTETYNGKCGQLVKVRPCNEKYGGKTYLGIFLGDADIGFHVSHNTKSKELSIIRHYNPAIFVPELKEIIYGAGSWWGKINSEEELKEITDADINDVWYVKMLQNS